MLYYKVLREGIAVLPSADEAVRAEIKADALAHGWGYVHQQLAEVDPVAATRIHPNDPQRIERALEVYRISGKSLTQWHEAQRAKGNDQSWGGDVNAFPYDVTSIAVCPEDRARLHERIAQRFHIMLNDGFMDEVKRLYDRGDLDPSMPSIRAVGYRQAWDCLEGKLSYDEMVERGIIATRQLAKRQITWLRSWSDLHWFDGEDPDLIEKVLKIAPLAPILR